MSRMVHSGDISYSSINAPNFNSHRTQSCFRTCFLNLPYATITSTFLVVSGLLITFFSSIHLAGVFDRFSQDLFHKRYLWLNEFRVVLWFVGGFLLIIILTNLIIGFATSSATLTTKGAKDSCSCTRNSTTNCLVRFVFLLNQLIFIIVLLLLIAFCVFSFVLFVLTTLCNDESRSVEMLLNHDRSFEQAYPGNSINLQPFAPMLFFKGNETQMLLFRDNRLKTLCRDYVSTLTLYNLIALLGIVLLFIGFHCYLINLTVNRIRIATYKKYTELLYLNGTELNTFNDASYDNGERF
ncbi:hypothetical protein RDWZM_009351 [Blomia tropicalis]|uniref:Uncharacterized protein n=1 Tax=Blomia tropicalis TaxID=40697 RepID=A0A9Q0M3I7_BLOTA|nr:hypothetical protein RDWZM_009351 [Blomia tropicalis]